MAEEFIKRAAPGRIEAYSSSFESGKIGPLPVAVMKEEGIDLPTCAPKSVYDRFMEKEVFDYVITLCHAATTEQCPIFKTNIDVMYAKKAIRLSWSIPGFMSLEGTDDEQKSKARQIRDQIKKEVLQFLSHLGIKTFME